jgi:hypothetical protein
MIQEMGTIEAGQSTRICSVRECGRRAGFASEMCSDCEAMSRELDSYWAKHRRKAEKRAARLAVLTDVAWLLVFLALMCALGYYLWPYVWATWELWTGTGAN